MRALIRKFILKYIRKYGYLGWDSKFIFNVMKACHEARQNQEDDQTVPGRIYEVVEDCIKAIPQRGKLDLSLDKVLGEGIHQTVDNCFDLDERTEQVRIANKSW